jgi:hypothetical protein
MDALTLVTVGAVVLGVAVFFHRMMKSASDPKHLPPGAITVERFYDENPLRRSSAEVDLGDGWRSPDELRCTFSVFWLEDTGEVYALRVPNPPSVVHDGVGDHGYGGSSLAPATVEVLGRVPTREELDERLEGWDTRISDPDGLGWLRQQLSIH